MTIRHIMSTSRFQHPHLHHCHLIVDPPGTHWRHCWTLWALRWRVEVLVGPLHRVGGAVRVVPRWQSPTGREQVYVDGRRVTQ